MDNERIASATVGIDVDKEDLLKQINQALKEGQNVASKTDIIFGAGLDIDDIKQQRRQVEKEIEKLKKEMSSISKVNMGSVHKAYDDWSNGKIDDQAFMKIMQDSIRAGVAVDELKKKFNRALKSYNDFKDTKGWISLNKIKPVNIELQTAEKKLSAIDRLIKNFNTRLFDEEEIKELLALLNTLNENLADIKKSIGTVDDNDGFNNIVSSLKDLQDWLSKASDSMKEFTQSFKESSDVMDDNTNNNSALSNVKQVADASEKAADAAKEATKETEKFNQAQKEIQGNKITIFDGVSTQIYDVEKDLDSLNKKLDEMAEKMQNVSFHAGDLSSKSLKSSNYYPADSYKFARDMNRFDSPATGTYFASNFIDIQDWANENNLSHIYATDLAKYGKSLLNINTDDISVEYTEFLEKLSVFVMKAATGEQSFSDKLKKYKIDSIDDLYKDGSDYFKIFNISVDQLSQWLEKEVIRVKDLEASTEDVRHKADSINTSFQKHFLHTNGLNYSNSSMDDSTARGSAIFNIDKDHAFDIDFGRNDNIATDFYRKVLMKKLEEKTRFISEKDDIDYLISNYIVGEIENLVNVEDIRKRLESIFNSSNTHSISLSDTNEHILSNLKTSVSSDAEQMVKVNEKIAETAREATQATEKLAEVQNKVEANTTSSLDVDNKDIEKTVSSYQKLLDLLDKINDANKSQYEKKSNTDWREVYRSKEEAINADIDYKKKQLNPYLNLILSEDETAIKSLKDRANTLKTALKPVNALERKIKNNSSLSELEKKAQNSEGGIDKTFALEYQAIDDRLGELQKKYQLTNAELEEYVTLQEKAFKITKYMSSIYGGYNAAGAESERQLRSWTENSFARTLGIDNKNGIFTNIEKAREQGLQDGTASLFYDTGEKISTRKLAAEILDYNGLDKYDKELQNINAILNYIKKNAEDIKATDFTSQISNLKERVDRGKERAFRDPGNELNLKMLKEFEEELEELIQLQNRLQNASSKTTPSQEQSKQVVETNEKIAESAKEAANATEKVAEATREAIQETEKLTQAQKEASTTSQTSDSSTVNKDISKEKEELETLEQKVKDVTDAVEAKSTAFTQEKLAVETAVQKEVSDLNELLDKINKIESAVKELADIPIKIDIQVPENMNGDISEVFEKLKTTLSEDFINSLNTLSTALQDLKLNNSFSDNLQDAAAGIALFRDELGKIDSNGSEFLKDINELLSKTDELKNLATILNSTKKQVEQAKQTVSKTTAPPEKVPNYSSSVNKYIETKNNQIKSIELFKQGASIIPPEFENKIEQVKNKIKDLQDEKLIGDKPVSDAKEQIDKIESEINSMITELRSDKMLKPIKDTAKTNLDNKIQKWASDNSAAVKDFGKELADLRVRLANVDNGFEYEKIASEFNLLQIQAREAGKVGKSFFDQWSGRMQNLAVYLTSFASFYDIVNLVKQLLGTIKNLDTEIVDIRKTFHGSNKELEEMYNNSSRIGKEIGANTQAVLQQEAAWSRAGYSTKADAEAMAEKSSVFASISPNMDVDTSQQGLVSVMKAFDIETSDVEREIMDNINAIGNTLNTTNTDIIEGLQRSSAALSAGNSTLQESIALFAAGQEILNNAETMGQSLKTISLRIRGFDEETEELSDDLKNISGDIADLTKTAEHPLGVSLFTDDTLQTYKSPYQVLSDIHEIYDELSDKQQAKLTQKLFGTTRAQAGNAILANWDAAEKAMKEMENAAGSSEAEMDNIKKSIEYNLNELSQEWVGTWQRIIDRGDIVEVIDLLTALSKPLGWFIEHAGVLTAVLGGTAFWQKDKSNNEFCPMWM